MLTTSFTNEVTITRLRANVGDDYGTPVKDWSSPQRLEIPGCVWEYWQSAEVLGNREAQIGNVRVLCPYGADILAGDRVEDPRGGRPYEVVGDPMQWQSATGLLDHTEVILTRAEG